MRVKLFVQETLTLKIAFALIYCHVCIIDETIYHGKDLLGRSGAEKCHNCRHILV